MSMEWFKRLVEQCGLSTFPAAKFESVDGEPSGDPNVGNAILTVKQDAGAPFVSVLGLVGPNGESIATILDLINNGCYIQVTPDGLAFGNIDFSVLTSGGLRFTFFADELSLLAPKIGFYGQTPATKQVVNGGYGGNSAIQSLIAALGTVGLVQGGTLVNGQELQSNGAIDPDAGCVTLNSSSALACTLATPTAGQDFELLRIVNVNTGAHTIVTPAGFNGGGAGTDTLTFTSASPGDAVTLMAKSGIWYFVSKNGTITLS